MLGFAGDFGVMLPSSYRCASIRPWCRMPSRRSKAAGLAINWHGGFFASEQREKGLRSRVATLRLWLRGFIGILGFDEGCWFCLAVFDRF